LIRSAARSLARPRALAPALALTCALLVCSAGTAQAEVVLDKVTHKRFGIVPPATAAGALFSGAKAAVRPFTGPACDALSEDCTALSYNGGPVQHGERDYLFFWEPAGFEAPTEYIAGLQRWLEEVEADDYNPGIQFAVNQQYYDFSGPGASKRFVPFAVEDAGTIIDRDSYPTSECVDEDSQGPTTVCVTNEQIAAELSTYISAHHLPTGIDVQYFVLTPEGVGSCFDSSSSECAYGAYCGYHDSAGSGESSEIVYADLPWLYEVEGCDVAGAFGVGHANSDKIDSVVSVFSHELSETMTDPNLNAWYQSGGVDSGYEIGDKCAYIYGPGGEGSLSGLSKNAGGYWNTELEGNDYLMQLEFDNRLKNCVREDGDTQPALSVHLNPASPEPSSAVKFTAEVTDPAGVNNVQWTFGDGAGAVGETASAGPETLTALVTDQHGNEKKLTEQIEVALGSSSESPPAEGGGSGEGTSGSTGSTSHTGTGSSSTPGSSTTTTTSATTTSGVTAGAGGKGPAPGTSTSAKSHCRLVSKRVHGHPRKVRVCSRPKPKKKAKTGAKHG